MTLKEFVKTVCDSSERQWEDFGLLEGLPTSETKSWFSEIYLPPEVAGLFSEYDGQDPIALKLLGR